MFGAIITIDKVVDIFKKWKRPANDVDKKLAADKTRLDNHERMLDTLQGSNRVLCAGVIALLDHELHNGNSEQMEKARNDIIYFLQNNIK